MPNPERVRKQQKTHIPELYTKRPEQLLAVHYSNPLAIQKATAIPNSLIQSDILQLQKTIGNQAVIQLMEQAELSNNKPLQKKVNNTGLPDNLKAGVENHSGYDMSEIRVHYNSDKPAQMGALAYTQGTNIHLGTGQEKHLPHELGHVVQQAQGRVKPTTQILGQQVNDDETLENEASTMGKQYVNHSSHTVNNPNKTGYPAGQVNVVQKMKLIDNSFDTRKWPDWLPQMLKGAAVVDNWDTLQQIHEALRRKGALAKLPFHEHDVFFMIHKAITMDNPDPFITECQQRFQSNVHITAAPDQAVPTSTVDVPTGNCKTADHNQQISTSGLTWCIAVGIRGETDKKKILFHITGGEVANTNFENKTEYEQWASTKRKTYSWENRFEDHFDELEEFIMGQQNTTMFILFGGNHDTEARRREFTDNPRVYALMGEVTRVQIYLGNSITIGNDDNVVGNCVRIN